MEYQVFQAKVSWWNKEKQICETLIGEGSNQCGLYNWCIEQMAILSQNKNYKGIQFMIVEEDTYNTDDEYWYKEINENETEEKTETERQTEEKTEP